MNLNRHALLTLKYPCYGYVTHEGLLYAVLVRVLDQYDFEWLRIFNMKEIHACRMLTSKIE